MDLPPLAFVDVETTGVNPRENRITEIGMITVDGDRASEWTTVINPLTRRQERPHLPDGITDEMRGAAPRFKDIAADLARRLAGRLFIAHNARFDYEFLKAEFGRTGIEFHPEVLCSLMLSRRLYSQSGHHDLDSLIERHGLEAEVRHRALHDAKLIWQFWQTIHRDHPAAALVTTIEALRAGPVLPAYLHPALIDRLPEAPGVYVFHGEGDEILRAGTASNLKARVLQYFRLDLVSARALAVSHRIRNITWRVTKGILGAQLQLALLSGTALPAPRQRCRTPYSWRFAPDAYPCLSLISLSERAFAITDELFGVFDSPHKARNALRRIAAAHELCHSLLGVAEGPDPPCPACPVEAGTSDRGRGCARLIHLTRAFSALRELRLPAWPYQGPIGIRERSDLHIVDRWRYLGTARNEAEIHAALETRDVDFDVKIFHLLVKALRVLPRTRIVCLASRSQTEKTDQDRVIPL
ncbi:MAG: exonuclease domain-containing protein [Casimicrobiaceae bacterium]